MIPWNVIENSDGTSVVSAYVNGRILHAHSGSHPNYGQIIDALNHGKDADSVESLFDIEKAVEQAFSAVTNRVKVAVGQIYFDGKVLDNEFGRHMERLLADGRYEDLRILARFWEKVSENPSDEARRDLLKWIASHDLSITPDGDIIGYKGVQRDYSSTRSGPGIVNGVRTHGHLNNYPGNVIEMDRDDVDPNAGNPCSVGLHVGTFGHASSFAGEDGRIMVLHVNPRDVVSVPSYDVTKFRCCRYTVSHQVTEPYGEAVVHEPERESFSSLDAFRDWDLY